jgi:hypothetical protein
MNAAARFTVVATALALGACSPVNVARIGPQLPPRAGDCTIEILDRGATPQRPYRDVGLVTIENCQDYRTAPCRAWLEEAVCGLGGQVAYVSEERRPDSGLTPPMRVQVLAAVYVSDLRPDPETDPVLGSRGCDPECGAGSSCEGGECKPAGKAGCAGGDEKPSQAAPPVEGPEKCLE